MCCFWRNLHCWEIFYITAASVQLTKSEFQDVIESYSAGHTDLVFKVEPSIIILIKTMPKMKILGERNPDEAGPDLGRPRLERKRRVRLENEPCLEDRQHRASSRLHRREAAVVYRNVPTRQGQTR